MLKKLILYCGLMLGFVLAKAQDFPEKSTTLVTDYTGTLSADQKQQLENKLVAYNDSTTTQIAVVLMKSVGDYDINEYGALLGRKWGIGSKDKNNGILVLVAVQDRKLTIQTGYGAEGALPDAITQDIIQHDIKPRFKAGDYYGGLDAGTTDIMKYMKGEYKASSSDNQKAKSRHKSDGGSAIFIVIIVVFILIIIFRNRGGGGGGRIIDRRGGASPFWWFLAGSMLSGGNRRNDGWGGFSGGGGGWGGGSSGGGGGFGGFGGGSFGGGGSSGSW